MTEIEKLRKEIEMFKSELEKREKCYLKFDEKFLYVKAREANTLKENQNLQYELKRMQNENCLLYTSRCV